MTHPCGPGFTLGSVHHGAASIQAATVSPAVDGFVTPRIRSAFGGRPFGMLILRRSDRAAQYPKCSSAENTARLLLALAATVSRESPQPQPRPQSGDGDVVAAAPLAGGLLMPLLLATDEKDPEFIAELRLRLSSVYVLPKPALPPTSCPSPPVRPPLP